MSLTDLMSGADLAFYPQVAMVIFVVVFLAMTARILGRRRPGELARWASLPLEDGQPGATKGGSP